MTQALKVFQTALKEKLGDNLSPYLFEAVCNTLSLDFVLRKGQTNIKQHATNCANNISNYILDKKILNDNFNEVLTIFSIAIANPSNPKNLVCNTQEQKADMQIIDNIINTCPNLCIFPEDDKQTIRNILTNLKTIDKEVDLGGLLKNTTLLSKNLKDISSMNKCQRKVEEEILQFLQLRKLYRINTQTASKDIGRSVK
jgi:hypothetical protein